MVVDPLGPDGSPRIETEAELRAVLDQASTEKWTELGLSPDEWYLRSYSGISPGRRFVIPEGIAIPFEHLPATLTELDPEGQPDRGRGSRVPR